MRNTTAICNICYMDRLLLMFWHICLLLLGNLLCLCQLLDLWHLSGYVQDLALLSQGDLALLSWVAQDCLWGFLHSMAIKIVAFLAISGAVDMWCVCSHIGCICSVYLGCLLLNFWYCLHLDLSSLQWEKRAYFISTDGGLGLHGIR